MKTRLNDFFILLLITLCGANFKALSQNKKANDDVIKITAELVQVDVTVTDKNNKPVSGLKRDDFELFDNGKLQNITTFAFEETRSRRIEEDTEQARSLPKAMNESVNWLLTRSLKVVLQQNKSASGVRNCF